ncbi:MAG: RluA family pseudouridine synthase [Deltaproteobacteria bacterium]|nr:RluA family pseudouridine synthase [Deltaproteobacteria bacterium]
MSATWSVLHEDERVLAVAKPAGLVVVPARGEDPATCLRRRLEQERGESLWVVHRLDRDTSGVVVFARDAGTHRALSLAFERHEVRKTYLAVVRAPPPAERGTIERPLHGARKGKMRPAARGEAGALPATTEYEVLRRWALPAARPALVEARPRTGRQHQLRVHLRSIGSPLLVDPLYGGAARVTAADLGVPGDAVLCDRLTLHALRIELPLAGGAAPLRVEAPLPDDLRALLAALDAAGGPGGGAR